MSKGKLRFYYTPEEVGGEGMIPHEDIRMAMRELFGTPNGREVFAFLLTELKHFDVIETEEDKALKNFASRLIQTLCPSNAAFSELVRMQASALIDYMPLVPEMETHDD